VFAGLFCGIAASATATLVGLIAVRYFFVPPAYSLTVPDAPQLAGLLVFLVVSAVILAIAELHRRSREALWRQQRDLERRVQERTSELRSANQSLSDVTGRLLHLQDEERRRLARELHDGAGQYLAALAMNLTSLAADIDRISKSSAKVSDSVSLVNSMSTDIRTISYLLHPPLLDEAGLAPALQWYIEGFIERSKIAVDLDLPRNLDRLPRDLETAIFRLVQECLTNVHRHSGSDVARIRLHRSSDEIRVEVEDEGRGLPSEKETELSSGGTPGVGIRGMRERFRQLGGTLEIASRGNHPGTIVTATLPLAKHDSSRVRAARAGTS